MKLASQALAQPSIEFPRLRVFRCRSYSDFPCCHFPCQETDLAAESFLKLAATASVSHLFQDGLSGPASVRPSRSLHSPSPTHPQQRAPSGCLLNRPRTCRWTSCFPNPPRRRHLSSCRIARPAWFFLWPRKRPGGPAEPSLQQTPTSLPNSRGAPSHPLLTVPLGPLYASSNPYSKGYGTVSH